jgi:hypothetical protein
MAIEDAENLTARESADRETMARYEAFIAEMRAQVEKFENRAPQSRTKWMWGESTMYAGERDVLCVVVSAAVVSGNGAAGAV